MVWYKRTLRVQFLNASDWQKAQVKRFAADWEEPSGVRFLWDIRRNADIRISFRKIGSWSYVGTEAEEVKAKGATMNLAIDEQTRPDYVKATIRHEFGHALGLKHEHQNWKKDFTWNEAAILEYYAAAGWTNQKTVHNVLRSLKDGPESTLRAEEFDPKSIMLYPIRAEHTSEGFSSQMNLELSALDKQTIRQLYGQ